MKKTDDKLSREILFYARKLPPIKQVEALDFIKWLWGGPSKKEEEFTKEEIQKIESLSKKKGGVKFKDWQSAKKYLESLMR